MALRERLSQSTSHCLNELREKETEGGEDTYMLSVWSVVCRGFESHPRQLIFLRKSDCLGCAVLLCFVCCLTLLDSFFLPSFSSLIKTCTRTLTGKLTFISVMRPINSNEKLRWYPGQNPCQNEMKTSVRIMDTCLFPSHFRRLNTYIAIHWLVLMLNESTTPCEETYVLANT